MPSLKEGSTSSQAKNEIEGVVDFVECLNIYPVELFGRPKAQIIIIINHHTWLLAANE